jgi:hypothetical protein
MLFGGNNKALGLELWEEGHFYVGNDYVVVEKVMGKQLFLHGYSGRFGQVFIDAAKLCSLPASAPIDEIAKVC